MTKEERTGVHFHSCHSVVVNLSLGSVGSRQTNKIRQIFRIPHVSIVNFTSISNRKDRARSDDA